MLVFDVWMHLVIFHALEETGPVCGLEEVHLDQSPE